MIYKISNYLALIVVIVFASNILFLSTHTEIVFAKKLKNDDDENEDKKEKKKEKKKGQNCFSKLVLTPLFKHAAGIPQLLRQIRQQIRMMADHLPLAAFFAVHVRGP